MRDDDIEPWTKKEAAAYCRMSIDTFDKSMRRHLKASRITGGKRSPLVFDAKQVRAVFSELHRTWGLTQAEERASAQRRAKAEQEVARERQRLSASRVA